MNRGDCTVNFSAMRYRSLAAILAMILLCVAAAEQDGSISGIVTDSDGKPVPNLALRLEKPSRISIKPPGGNVKHKLIEPLQTKPTAPPIATATTDAEGKFSMTGIPAGSYRLVGGSNSIGWVFQGITVDAGKETKLDVKLVVVKK
jgi:hypothetical protein